MIISMREDSARAVEITPGILAKRQFESQVKDLNRANIYTCMRCRPLKEGRKIP